MKLSIRELKEIRNNLPVNSELFKKINDKIYLKKADQEIEKAKAKIKFASQMIENIRCLIDYNKRETLRDLTDSIRAIKAVEVYSESCSQRTYITVESNELQDGEVERIINFKIKNPGHYLKFV